MRSGTDAAVMSLVTWVVMPAWCLALMGMTAGPADASSAASAASTTAANPDADQGVPEPVRRIVAEMKSASVPPATHKERQLRLKKSDAKSAAPPPWLTALVAWLADAGNGIMWLLGAIAVALLAVFAWRWAALRSPVRPPRRLALPSHVNALDIRPESLPADVAAAARALCAEGDGRAALSLLYRGALSRLIHDHDAPILASSTEGECARIAARLLATDAAAYVGELVHAWQLEVYAGRAATPDAMAALCSGFDVHFTRQADRDDHGAASPTARSVPLRHPA